MNSESIICFKCGTKFPKRRGYFQANYGINYKGVGFMHICKNCIDSMYDEYFKECTDQRTAVRQMCRKLDLFWSDAVFDLANLKSSQRSIMTQYISKVNNLSFAGKSYDDTLISENALWNFADSGENENREPVLEQAELRSETPPEIVAFWGSGYSDDMYKELEERRLFWMSRFPKGTKLDIGTEALIRQICALELDINRDRFEGKPIDKSVNALNTLLGSANLRPTQTKSEDNSAFDKTPFGVWVRKLENERPVSEPSEDMKDVDGIVRYISVWFLGHLCKMLKIKNSYSRLYEEEIERLRVSHPEYEDDDDESLVYDIFAADGEEQDEN